MIGGRPVGMVKARSRGAESDSARWRRAYLARINRELERPDGAVRIPDQFALVRSGEPLLADPVRLTALAADLFALREQSHSSSRLPGDRNSGVV
jgi:hypothetical protein